MKYITLALTINNSKATAGLKRKILKEKANPEFTDVFMKLFEWSRQA